MRFYFFKLWILCLIFFIITNCSSKKSSFDGDGAAAGVFATAYYIDATSGDDSNSGLSNSAAWKRLSKITTSILRTPAIIYLKKGETWNETLKLNQSQVTVDSYGSGSNPIIDGSISFTEVVSSGSIFTKVISIGTADALGNVSENGTMLTFLPWNTDEVTTFSGSINGSYSYEYLTHTLHIKPSSSGTNAYKASVLIYGVDATDLSDITIQNIQLQKISLHGVNFMNCIRCSLKNSVITQIGGAVIGVNSAAPPNYIYAGNGIQFGDSSIDGTVSGATISEIFDSGISPQTFNSHKHASGFSFDTSSISKCGFAGVEISVLSNGGTSGSSLRNVILSDLTIADSGKGWSQNRYGNTGIGIRIVADATAGTISDVTVKNSVVSGTDGDGVVVQGESGTVNLVGMKIKSNSGYGVYVADASATSLKLNMQSSLVLNNVKWGMFFNVSQGNGLVLYHNTFYNNAASFATKINLGILYQAGVADIRNNVFAANYNMTHLYSMLSLQGPPILDYNCYHELGSSIGYNGSAYATVGDFRTASSLEAHGIEEAIAFVDASNDNFTLVSGSNCKASGVFLSGVSSDFNGNAYSNPPNRGAIQ